jgi:hypothetical protein
VPTGQSPWNIAAENIIAGVGWTEWTDQSAAQAWQRLYRVVPQTAGSLPVVTPLAVTPPVEEKGALRYAADPGTVKEAQKSADQSWARLKEAGDAGRLIGALGAGKYPEAVQVLREYGVAESTLAKMADQLGQTPPRAMLNESFLRGAVCGPMSDPPKEVESRLRNASAQGYQRMYWVINSLGPDWALRYDPELAQFREPPIAVLDVRLHELDTIRFFKWFDRYAERLHSVVVNWESLSNFDLKRRYTDADLVMSGLYKLIKARRPETFVWVRVVWQEDESDARWLAGLTFAPDGLVIWNLHSFRSPFERARAKYLPLVGEATPMVVAEFYGYYPKLASVSDVAELGKLIAPNMSRLEQRLKELGYSGLAPDWLLFEAVAKARQ